MTTLFLVLVVFFHAFFNGFMVAEVCHTCYEEETYSTAWNKMVLESQDTKIGRFLMKTFYIVPTVISLICKDKILFATQDPF